MPLKVSTALGVCVHFSGKSVHSMHRAFQSLEIWKGLALDLDQRSSDSKFLFCSEEGGWGAKCLAEKLAGAGSRN